MSQGQSDEPLFVVVNGPPGSGKTTLGKELASRIALPLFSKDAIKEALMDECRRSIAIRDLCDLQGHVVEIFCRCSRELCLARYRARSADRHPGHFDAERSAADV